ncbi:MAG: methyl-accepting chemotaxis protein, partial [Alphaproteobacteria bacterium]|nr:methyl-accepting chemotaxis protein [Alphaproteobacteria bacterium]
KKMQEQESRLAAEKLDLQEMAAAEQHADRGRIAGLFEASIRTVVDTLGDSVGRLEGAAGKMTVLMDRTEDNTRAAAGAADEAAGSVRTVAAATEELSASIGEINRQVVQSSQIAQHAVAQARQANETVESLANAGIKIGEVVSLINEIAGQTNLLALNATIEAARAGEAGKGFAVVANEVKSLANQTARATEDISRQVEAIQGATGGAVTAIREVTATIEDIEQISGTIASAVDQQRSSTEEIARNVQNVSTGTEDVTRNISGVRQMNGDANAATGEVSEIASRLGLQSSKLAEEVDRFLQQIRNA